MTGWVGTEIWVRIRLVTVAVVAGGLFALLVHKAFLLQVREAKKLRELAEDQYLKEIELPSRRGRILDRKEEELAASAEVDSVFVNPRQIQASGQRDEIARTLARLLHLERQEVERPLSGRRYFAWVKRQLLPEEARAVREARLLGVQLTREPRRYYPGRTLAGPLLGWAGLDGRGLEGIELFHDKELRGSPAELPGLRDALGREVLPGGLTDVPSQAGHDLVTTIDKFIQYRLQTALEEGVQRHRAKAGVAVALDPKTGEVLGMASVPGLNPNDPLGARDRGARNRVVTDPYEPGSTLKTFSISAAVEAGLVRAEDKWFCENGKFKIGPAIIHDAEKIGHVTTVGVLAESSNICTAKIARRSGRERVEAMLRRFGFGAPTGIDLPGERGGLLRSSKKWGEVELATISFGQGMTATPLQLAAGYATIANRGVWMRPHVVRRVLGERGRTVREVAPEGRRVVDEKTAATMARLLHAVTLPGGTGEKLAIPGYPAAGKTGTAQKVDPVTRRYSVDKWASSFVGFAPLADPRLVILVMVDEPHGVHYGGVIAGPIWREVMIDSLRYLGVTPDGTALAESKAPSPPRPEAAPAPALPELAAADEGAEEEEGEAFLAVREEGAEVVAIPDFTGLSVGEALGLARQAGVSLEVVGSGRAVGQSPGPGRARERTHCRVSFAP